MKNISNDSDIAIIGLGSFGANVLENFYLEGQDVTIIDKDQSVINRFSSKSSNAIVADATQAITLKDIGIANYDHVVVAIGQDLNASILITLLLIEIGIKNIVVKAGDENHAKILKKIGAHRIVYPDREMGKRVSMQIIYSQLIEVIELNELQIMAEVEISSKDFINKTLSELDVTNRFNVIIVAIKRGENIINPSATEVLYTGDVLIIIGEKKKVEEITKVI